MDKKVPMPDDILQIAIDARAAQAEFDKMPPPPVTEHPMPADEATYESIF